ncbi:MAG: hypothetical protein V2A66_08165 [Pseudomonadota bacterium]
MKRNNEIMEKIFQAKIQRRQDLAQLPVEEKVRILVQLQKIASPILSARGLKREPWSV